MVTAAMTSAGVVGAMVFAGFTYLTTQQQVAIAQRQIGVAQDQIGVAQQQNQVAEQAQFTERFTNAVDQLDRAGPEHLQARLGGVYALERLARDSPRDHPTIIAVLSAFIGATSRSLPCDDLETPEDVSAALTVLARRETNHDNNLRIDLRGAKLSGADISGIDLTGADLRQTCMRSTTIMFAKLDEAKLDDADLRNAGVVDTSLNHASLKGTDLRGAFLIGSRLIESDLTSADLRGAELGNAKLDRSEHAGARVEGALTNENTTGKWW